MNRAGAYLRFFIVPGVGALTRRLGPKVRFEGSSRELPDHLLKDIGISPSDILALRQLRGDGHYSRQRR